MRKIEILIIVFVLFLLAALVGCKDEAEAVEKGTFDITLYPESEFEDANYTDVTFCYDHNGVTEELTLNVVNGEIVCSRSPKKAIEIIFKTMYYNWGERNKGDVYDLPVRFPEPNEPEPTWRKGSGDSLILSEPNEPTGLLEWDGKKECWVGVEYPAKESEYSLNIWEPNEIQKVSLDFIPTWPDYIELEKTLVLRYDYPEPNTSPHEISILPQCDTWVFTKGTKIYFKE